jgi:hypothetical protein
VGKYNARSRPLQPRPEPAAWIDCDASNGGGISLARFLLEVQTHAADPDPCATRPPSWFDLASRSTEGKFEPGH